MNVMLRHLPGESARASLKPPRTGIHRGRRGSGSPGRIGPGLIEASPPVASGRGPDPHLPGESARASLKLLQVSKHADGTENLPGESARASLKLHPRAEFLVALDISRANRPGPH